MTKAELIEALEEYPDDAEINVYCEAVGDETCWPPLVGVIDPVEPGSITLSLGGPY